MRKAEQRPNATMQNLPLRILTQSQCIRARAPIYQINFYWTAMASPKSIPVHCKIYRDMIYVSIIIMEMCAYTKSRIFKKKQKKNEQHTHIKLFRTVCFISAFIYSEQIYRKLLKYRFSIFYHRMKQGKSRRCISI